MVSEDQLIERVRRLFLSTRVQALPGDRLKKDGLCTGIGDDAAVLRPGAGTEWVVTTDAFLENGREPPADSG